MTTPEQKAVSTILARALDPCIVELGAHEGTDTCWMVTACTKPPRLVAVEADMKNFQRLVQGCQSLITRTPIFLRGAIAAQSGECDFWECSTPEGRGSGSIRRPTGHLVRNGVKYDFTKTTVTAYTLDQVFEVSYLDHIDMLWVDIQAAERDMIAGGRKALARTRHMFIEAESGPEMYEGQAMRDELLAMLPGWTLIGDFDFNVLLRNDGY